MSALGAMCMTNVGQKMKQSQGAWFKVGHWKQQFGVDGIDLDLETGAGDNPEAGINM